MGWKSKKDGTHFNTDKTIRSSEPSTEINMEIDNNSEEFAENVRREYEEYLEEERRSQSNNVNDVIHYIESKNGDFSWQLDPELDYVGTSLQGYTGIKYDDMVKIFGNPHAGYDKSMHQWTINVISDDGVKSPVIIYDYKDDGKETNDWHIGGKDKHASNYVDDIIQSYYVNN